MLRHFLAVLAIVLMVAPVSAQEQASDPAGVTDRSATGGAQTLEDILARQRGESVDSGFRQIFGNPDSAAGIANQLGTLGGASDPDLFLFDASRANLLKQRMQRRNPKH